MPTLTTDVFGNVAQNIVNTSPSIIIGEKEGANADTEDTFPNPDWEQDVVAMTHEEWIVTSTPQKPNKGKGREKFIFEWFSETKFELNFISL